MTTPQKYDCIGIGLVTLDRFMLLNRYPQADEKVEAVKSVTMMGGPIANALSVLGRLNCKTAFCGKIGNDDSGKIILRELSGGKVDSSALIQVADSVTPEAQIWVDGNAGTRNVVLYRDKAVSLRPEELPLDLLKNSAFLLIDGRDTEANLLAAAVVRENGGQVVGGFGSLRARMDELIRVCDYLIVSNKFVRQLAPNASIKEVLVKLYSEGIKLAAVTTGEHGCIWIDRGGIQRTPAFEITPLDTTGAGDSFHGAFTYGLLKGWEPGDCIEFASAAAAMTCRVISGNGGFSSENEIRKFMEDHPLRKTTSSV